MNNARFIAACQTDKKRTQKARLIRKYQQCPYCGVNLTKQNRSIEHVIPKSSGVRHVNHRSNLILCCIDCNRKRGNQITIPAMNGV